MKSISKIWQRTPISYYGGKQTMLPYILPLITKLIHNQFLSVEQYFGQKHPSKLKLSTTSTLMSTTFIKFYKPALLNSKPLCNSLL